MTAAPAADSSPAHKIQCEIDDLIEKHVRERAVICALPHDMTVLLADADRLMSRGYLRSFFSHGARNTATDEEP